MTDSKKTESKTVEVARVLTLHGYAKEALEILEEKKAGLQELTSKMEKAQQGFFKSWNRKNLKFVTMEMLRQFPRGTNPIDAFYFLLQDSMEEKRAKRDLSPQDQKMIKGFLKHKRSLVKSVTAEILALDKWEKKWMAQIPEYDHTSVAGVMADRRSILNHFSRSFEDLFKELQE